MDKRMPRRVTENVVRFKSPPRALFEGTDCDPLGPTIHTQAVALDFDYAQFGSIAATTGYEKLLYDCMTGDPKHFHRADMVEAAWKIADPICTTWAENPPLDFPNYAPGTWGPPEARGLRSHDGHDWWTT